MTELIINEEIKIRQAVTLRFWTSFSVSMSPSLHRKISRSNTIEHMFPQVLFSSLKMKRNERHGIYVVKPFQGNWNYKANLKLLFISLSPKNTMENMNCFHE